MNSVRQEQATIGVPYPIPGTDQCRHYFILRRIRLLPQFGPTLTSVVCGIWTVTHGRLYIRHFGLTNISALPDHRKSLLVKSLDRCHLGAWRHWQKRDIGESRREVNWHRLEQESTPTTWRHAVSKRHLCTRNTPASLFRACTLIHKASLIILWTCCYDRQKKALEKPGRNRRHYRLHVCTECLFTAPTTVPQKHMHATLRQRCTMFFLPEGGRLIMVGALFHNQKTDFLKESKSATYPMSNPIAEA